MEKKAIAAVLLLSIAAWAELALAPMLLMHTGHLRPGHEMAVDAQAPGAHSAHHHPSQAKAGTLPCCPGLLGENGEAVISLVTATPGCDNSHDCCFRQGPQSVPAPVRDVQRFDRQMSPASQAKISLPAEAETRFSCDILLVLRPYPDVFGMTLRI